MLQSVVLPLQSLCICVVPFVPLRKGTRKLNNTNLYSLYHRPRDTIYAIYNLYVVSDLQIHLICKSDVRSANLENLTLIADRISDLLSGQISGRISDLQIKQIGPICP